MSLSESGARQMAEAAGPPRRFGLQLSYRSPVGYDAQLCSAARYPLYGVEIIDLSATMRRFL